MSGEKKKQKEAKILIKEGKYTFLNVTFQKM